MYWIVNWTNEQKKQIFIEEQYIYSTCLVNIYMTLSEWWNTRSTMPQSLPSFKRIDVKFRAEKWKTGGLKWLEFSTEGPMTRDRWRSIYAWVKYLNICDYNIFVFLIGKYLLVDKLGMETQGFVDIQVWPGHVQSSWLTLLLPSSHPNDIHFQITLIFILCDFLFISRGNPLKWLIIKLT